MALSMNLGAEDKKKMYLLGGLLGVLGVVGAVTIVSQRGSDDPDLATSAISTNNVASNNALSTATPPSNAATFGNATLTSTSTSSSGGSSSNSAASGTGATEGAVLSPQLIGVGRTRNNPFAQEVVPLALPTPVPAPTPVPTPKVTYRNRTTFERLAPIQIAPYQLQSESTNNALPGAPNAGFGAGGSDGSLSSGNTGLGVNNSRILLSLPPATIFGATARTAPRPIPTIGGLDVATPGAQADVVSADDKRVSGVIIGDTIRALIEYQENGRQVSRVVQAGDSVGGMEILSIRRLTEGGEPIIRVTVREQGLEKFFDLKSR